MTQHPHSSSLENPPVTLSTRGLSKDYGPARVVSDISLDFYGGSIHALLGENGAGKSTLIGMISGNTAPSAGTIHIGGARRRLRSIRDGQENGVVALPQELSLVPTLGAAENIYLGMRRPGARVITNRTQLERDAGAELDRLGQNIPLRVPVEELSAVQQTMIALARALVRDARILILDEPTAALTDTETEQLFTVLRGIRDAGTAILYVSHRLDEVFSLADTATVMRNGKRVWTRAVTDISTADVVSAMTGQERSQLFPPRAEQTGDTAPQLLRVEDVHGFTLRGVSLTAQAGRVLGIAGLAGSGRSELLKIIAGAHRAHSGRVYLDGTDITTHSLAQTMRAGIAFVPEERRSEGLVMTDSIQHNIALANLRALSRYGITSPSREKVAATERAHQLQIKANSIRQPVNELSGGNQQKVVLAKYLELRPRVLLLDEPTRGIDVGTKAEIYQLIRGLAEKGLAVVMVSSEIPELLGVADDIAVFREGRLGGVVNASPSTEESILNLCYRKPE